MGALYPSDDQDACKCGRIASKIHCPQCGYYTVYGFASRRDTVTSPNGEQRQVPVFRCRRCTHVFNDVEWREHCSAPFLKPTSDTTALRQATQMLNKLDELPPLASNVERIKNAIEKQRKADTESSDDPVSKFFSSDRLTEVRNDMLKNKS